MPSFVEIGPPVLEKMIFEFEWAFTISHIWAWWPSWSCDMDYEYIRWLPLPIDASHKIWP